MGSSWTVTCRSKKVQEEMLAFLEEHYVPASRILPWPKDHWRYQHPKLPTQYTQYAETKTSIGFNSPNDYEIAVLHWMAFRVGKRRAHKKTLGPARPPARPLDQHGQPGLAPGHHPRRMGRSGADGAVHRRRARLAACLEAVGARDEGQRIPADDRGLGQQGRREGRAHQGRDRTARCPVGFPGRVVGTGGDWVVVRAHNSEPQYWTGNLLDLVAYRLPSVDRREKVIMTSLGAIQVKNIGGLRGSFWRGTDEDGDRFEFMSTSW